MILIVIALGALIITAQKKDTSPKLLIQSWFSHTGEQTIPETTGTVTMIPITTGESVIMTGEAELSSDDKDQVNNFLNSVVVTQ